jgi:hypothetical protein
MAFDFIVISFLLWIPAGVYPAIGGNEMSSKCGLCLFTGSFNWFGGYKLGYHTFGT